MEEVDLTDTYRAAAPGQHSLDATAVHVWAVPLVGDGERFGPLLSAAERQQADRYRFVDHRRRYAIAHGALRAILGGYLACDPAAIEFVVHPRGKPRLVERHGGLCFNLSHSGQLALVVIADVEVGVDLEKVRHLESLRDIARQNFSTEENAALERCADDQRLLAFYRCWTRKEAYVKALGTGLSTPLDVFDVSVDPVAAFAAFRDGQRVDDWGLWDVSPARDYVAAVAVRRTGCRLQTFRLTGL